MQGQDPEMFFPMERWDGRPFVMFFTPYVGAFAGVVKLMRSHVRFR